MPTVLLVKAVIRRRNAILPEKMPTKGEYPWVTAGGQSDTKSWFGAVVGLVVPLAYRFPVSRQCVCAVLL